MTTAERVPHYREEMYSRSPAEWLADTSFNPHARHNTLNFRGLVEELAVNRSDTLIQDAEAISANARRFAAALAANPDSLDFRYSGTDLIEGLLTIPCAETQLVVAEMIHHTTPEIARVAKLKLQGADLSIYPKTLQFLLTADDPESEKLALAILEHNQKAGFTAETVLPEVEAVIGKLLETEETAMQAAAIAALVNHRTHNHLNFDLKTRATHILSADIQKRVDAIRQSAETRTSQIQTIANANAAFAFGMVMEPYARTSARIDRDFPSDEEIKSNLAEFIVMIPEDIAYPQSLKILQKLQGDLWVSVASAWDYNKLVQGLFVEKAWEQIIQLVTDRIHEMKETERKKTEEEQAASAKVAQQARTRRERQEKQLQEFLAGRRAASDSARLTDAVLFQN